MHESNRLTEIDQFQAHNCPLFTATWFGRSGATPKGGLDAFNDDAAWRRAAIQDGRWAFAKMPALGDGTVWAAKAARELAEDGGAYSAVV